MNILWYLPDSSPPDAVVWTVVSDAVVTPVVVMVDSVVTPVVVVWTAAAADKYKKLSYHRETALHPV